VRHGRAHGRRRTFGIVGAFSFFPSKNLGGFGDGGLVVTDDDAVAERARMLRAHGSKRKYQNEMLGYNSRLDELQAALLRVKLPHVDRWNAARSAVAHRYTTALRDLPGLVTPEVCDGHVFHQYTVRSTALPRETLVAALAQDGIDTMVYYPVPQHRLPVFSEVAMPALPVSERAAQQVLSLPMGPNLTAVEVARVTVSLRTALSTAPA